MSDEMELQVAQMSDETMEYLDVLFGVCKRFGVDYYRASQKERDFVDAVAVHEYQLKKAREKGMERHAVPPFLGIVRSERSNHRPA